MSSIALVVCCAMLSGCGMLPFGSSGGSSTAVVVVSKPTTSTPTTSTVTTATVKAKAATVPTQTPFAASPAPRSYDPLLKNGDYGYQNEYKFERDVSIHSNSTNASVDNTENLRLESQQAQQLLKLFKTSPKTTKFIEQAGGDSDITTYTISEVSATAEGNTGVPWVTATLRANFGTEDGIKGLEVWVYRQRTRKGMSLKPFVSGAVIGYRDDQNIITEPVPVRY